jgi:peptidoglycan-associated lipoprotein
MKLHLQKLTLLLLGAALLAGGCTKKPQRPSPSDTVLGQGAGGIDPSASNIGGADLVDPSAAGLQARPPGVIEDADTIRGLLQSVYFDFDSSAIKAGERPKLQEAQTYLNANPGHRILLEGHCDWRGTAEYNLGLGDRRAGAAKQYLQSLGVPVAKLEIRSKGDLDAVENAAEDQMAKDRRVELVILKK